MAAQELDVAVVGNFSIDYLKLPSRSEPYTIMGGAVAYVSLSYPKIGWISSCGFKGWIRFSRHILATVAK